MTPCEDMSMIFATETKEQLRLRCILKEKSCVDKTYLNGIEIARFFVAIRLSEYLS